jgi:uncharacterized membrane protein
MGEIPALLTRRPYVVAFLLTFALLAWSERGAWRGFLWLVTGTAIGWLSEACSILTGFPFGHYVYHRQQFASELWLGPVPLFASLSFAFMSYFAFSAACQLLAPRNGEPRRAVLSADGALRTALLAAVIGTWMDTVIDPLTLIGAHWFLGDLYHYDPPGPHFGVPLINYGGWLLTIGAIGITNQMLDRMQVRRGRQLVRGPALPLQELWGLGCCCGVFIFMLTINVWLLVRHAAPADVPVGQILVSGLLSFTLFVVFIAILTRSRPAPAPRLADAVDAGVSYS